MAKRPDFAPHRPLTPQQLSELRQRLSKMSLTASTMPLGSVAAGTERQPTEGGMGSAVGSGVEAMERT